VISLNRSLFSWRGDVNRQVKPPGGVSTNIISSWPRHKKLFSTGSISVCYGKAITAEQAKNMGDEKLAELLTGTLRQMQTKIRVKQGKKPYDY